MLTTSVLFTAPLFFVCSRESLTFVSSSFRAEEQMIPKPGVICKQTVEARSQNKRPWLATKKHPGFQYIQKLKGLVALELKKMWVAELSFQRKGKEELQGRETHNEETNDFVVCFLSSFGKCNSKLKHEWQPLTGEDNSLPFLNGYSDKAMNENATFDSHKPEMCQLLLSAKPQPPPSVSHRPGKTAEGVKGWEDRRQGQGTPSSRAFSPAHPHLWRTETRDWNLPPTPEN